jgi:hypothetical protein
VADGAMMAELQKLHRRAVVLSSMHASVTHQPEEIAYELHRQLCVPHWNITISRHKPENFPVRFDYPDQRDTAMRAHSLQVGMTVCLIQPWRLEGYTRPTNWYFRAKICVKRLPLHAWSMEGVHQLLDDTCIFDHMEQESFTQECTEVFSFFAWMSNPDLLPRSKTVTLFNERAGRSDVNGGPPPAAAPLSSPLVGREVVILIHLNHYFDWSPQPYHSPSSSVSGLLGSDGSSSGGQFPVFHSFPWTRGWMARRRLALGCWRRVGLHLPATSTMMTRTLT